MTNQSKPSVYCLLFFLFFAGQTISNGSGIRQGFTDIVQFWGGCIAVGTDGRIDRITPSGDRVAVDRSNHDRLNCVFSNDELLIAAGDRGTILYSSDGESFCRASSGTDQSIHGIASLNGSILAGADNGTLLVSRDGKFWSGVQTGAKGNILSLSVNETFCIGVTDESEIIQSTDGIRWEVLDYNQEYAGFNPPSKFIKILAVQNGMIIIGTHDDGSPSILVSSEGNVWAERSAVYRDDGGRIRFLTQKPNDLTYDPDGDRLILACDGGELFVLPACAKCNEWVKVTENDLHAIVYADHRLFIAGDEFSVFVQRL